MEGDEREMQRGRFDRAERGVAVPCSKREVREKESKTASASRISISLAAAGPARGHPSPLISSTGGLIPSAIRFEIYCAFRGITRGMRKSNPPLRVDVDDVGVGVGGLAQKPLDKGRSHPLASLDPVLQNGNLV